MHHVGRVINNADAFGHGVLLASLLPLAAAHFIVCSMGWPSWSVLTTGVQLPG